jgi:antitoxin VapB
MQTHKTKPFKSGNSQAVRLPKAFAYPEGTELELMKEGAVVTLRPVPPTKITFQEMLERMKALPKPSYVEVRDVEEIPERPGL